MEHVASQLSLSIIVQVGVKPTIMQTRVLLIRIKNAKDLTELSYFLSNSLDIDNIASKSTVTELLAIFNHARDIRIYFGNFNTFKYDVPILLPINPNLNNVYVGMLAIKSNTNHVLI